MTVNWFNFLTKEDGPGGGLNQNWWLHHRSLAKSSNGNAYLLANEWIAANLANYLRLPIPPFALARTGPGGTRYITSLDVSEGEMAPRDMRPARLVHCLPHLSSGIVLFDIFIANPDRHEGNVIVDDALNPKQVAIIDHDCALFGQYKGRGIRRLEVTWDGLGLSKGSGSSQSNKIASEIETDEYFEEWIERIEETPDRYIELICSETGEMDITNEERQFCSQFLKDRKHKLREIIRGNKKFFDSISNWGVLFQ